MPRYFISYDFNIQQDGDIRTGSGCTIINLKYKIRDMDDIMLITKEIKEIQERKPLGESINLHDANIAIKCIQKL